MGLHTQELSRHLVRRGHKVLIITPFSQDVQLEHNGALVFGVKSFYLPKWPLAWSRTFSVPYCPLSLISSMKKLVHDYKIDLLHAHGQKYMITWMAVDLAFRMKLPSILTIHGIDALRYYGAFAGAMEEIVNQIMFRETVRKVRAVLYDNKLQLRYWSEYCDSTRFWKYTQGIEVSRFTNALKHKEKFRQEYGIPIDKKVILYLGRLDSAKGILELIGAIKSVTEKFDDAFFLIVGEGPLMKETRSHASGQKGKVMILPWVPYSRVHKIYALADVFVLPSKSEGQSRVALEAMASQLYLVTMAIGGIAETLAGYKRKTYIKACSASGISNALIHALNILSKMRKIEPAVQSYIEKFDWSHQIAEIERVYKSVVSTMYRA